MDISTYVLENSKSKQIKYVELTTEFAKFDVRRDEIDAVCKTANTFTEAQNILSGYVHGNKLVTKLKDPKPLDIDTHLDTYSMLKKNDSLNGYSWSSIVDDLINTAKHHKLYSLCVFRIAETIGDYNQMTDFFKFYIPNEELNLVDQLYQFNKHYEKDKDLVEQISDLDECKFTVEPEKLYTESYRDDPRDSAHYFEHAMSRTDR